MFLSVILSGIHRWLGYRAAVRELSGLSDRQLSDIGLSRGTFLKQLAKAGEVIAKGRRGHIAPLPLVF
jgi:uncharacterized protein YjiS (DUF1127 family)